MKSYLALRDAFPDEPMTPHSPQVQLEVDGVGLTYTWQLVLPTDDPFQGTLFDREEAIQVIADSIASRWSMPETDRTFNALLLGGSGPGMGTCCTEV